MRLTGRDSDAGLDREILPAAASDIAAADGQLAGAHGGAHDRISPQGPADVSP